MLATQNAIRRSNHMKNKQSFPKSISLDPFKLNLAFIGRSKSFNIVSDNLFHSEMGCYLVAYYKNKKLIKSYFGKYSSTLRYRWVNLNQRKDCTTVGRHDKYEKLLADSDNGVIAIYAISERQICNKMKNKLFNNAWFEEFVLRKFRFKFNKLRQNKKVYTVKSNGF